MNTGRGGDWQDIGRKLPLLTTVLLAIAVVVIATTAYVEMKRARIAAVGEHMMGVSEEISSSFAQSNVKLAREGSPLSHDSTLRNVLARPSAPTLAAAQRHIADELARSPVVMLVELRDARGARIAVAGDTALPLAPANRRSSPVGPLIALHDTVITDTRLPVLGEAGDTLGYVRELARASSTTSAKLLSGLIGGKAILLVGNVSGNLWTNLDTRVDGPPSTQLNAHSGDVAMADGTKWIGALSAVSGSPWAVWVARPEAEVLADAHNFLMYLLLVALGVIVLGGVAARVLGRHIIAPLSGLTHAAEGIAGGDYSTRVPAVRNDEVGRLAVAFNNMAQAIQTASFELENQQTELEIQQVELEESNEQLRETIGDLTRARDAERQSHARAEKLEGQLQQAHKMEAIGRLAGGVAHDFNNILTVIISYTDLVLADEALTDTSRADLTKIRTGADRASALTRQLLAFSRKQVLHPTLLNLNATVIEFMSMLTRVMPANIAMSTALDETAYPICVDRGQLEQVLMNLAVNARDAMPTGGSLVIETSSAMLDDTFVALHTGGTPGPHVVLSVRDTGMGMDADTLDRIFEPFFTTKEAGQGTGLGLAMVYGIVRQSGGSIYVYSEPGMGTTFKIYFPADESAVQSLDDAGVSALPAVEPATVLLVEDDPSVRLAAKAVLEQLGHTVMPVENVAAALAVVRADGQRFDIVLTDAVMPGQGGLELAAILRQEKPELPVILMSGYAEDVASGDESSASGIVFLEKPFTAPSVARAFVAARGGPQSTKPGADWIT
ncbi:MAG TPA: ATP-binding protein [Gemmatimonadaceae bacterium]